MQKPELAKIKGKLFTETSKHKDFSVNDANVMVSESTYDGYAKLDAVDQWQVRQNKDRLVKTIHSLGEVGAMELLAAIGDVLNEEAK